MDEVFPENGLIIYPNPASHVLHIGYPNQTSNQSIQILDMQGHMILEAAFNTGLLLNTEHFPSGIYIIRISDSERQVLGKFVVWH